MKFILSIVMVAAFAVLAAAQVAAPLVEVSGRQGVRAGRLVTSTNEIRVLGNVIVKVNGVEIRADEMQGPKDGREFALRGNVRVILPAPLTP